MIERAVAMFGRFNNDVLPAGVTGTLIGRVFSVGICTMSSSVSALPCSTACANPPENVAPGIASSVEVQRPVAWLW